ncbi:MAG: DNA repair protein RecN, partial [Paracoccaceae bacterium]
RAGRFVERASCARQALCRSRVMLQSLSIRNILLIEALDLEFQPGLNVLTGETGAGKSILLDCLGFVLGWRGRAKLVRQGAETGEIAAGFLLAGDHPARAVLEEAGLPCGDELLLRRTVAADGRKRGFVNDRRISSGILRALSETLVELHGQRDDRGLLNQAGHRALLDDFGDYREAVAAVRTAWKNRAEAGNALRAAREELAEKSRDAEYLRHAADELAALDPQPGEDDELDGRRRLMRASLRVREDIARAGAALGLQGAEGLLGDATRWLHGAAAEVDGRLDDALDAAGRAMEELAALQQGVDNCLAALEFDPGELERVEERLFAIRGLARKHNTSPDALVDLAQDFRDRLAEIDTGSERIRRLEEALGDAESEYRACAARLTRKRTAAAVRLDQAMAMELPPLKLDKATFKTRVAPLDTPGPDGADRVLFTVATSAGAPPGPIDQIASGGELSRFLLALKVCLTTRSGDLAMIFDEIDRGIGGATADAVGRRLNALAAHGQVLVVTHSPQVAARAEHHWRVSRSDTDRLTTTEVAALDRGSRIDELARMLAGDKVTEAARSAAEALIRG